MMKKEIITAYFESGFINYKIKYCVEFALTKASSGIPIHGGSFTSLSQMFL